VATCCSTGALKASRAKSRFRRDLSGKRWPAPTFPRSGNQHHDAARRAAEPNSPLGSYSRASQGSAASTKRAGSRSPRFAASIIRWAMTSSTIFGWPPSSSALSAASKASTMAASASGSNSPGVTKERIDIAATPHGRARVNNVLLTCHNQVKIRQLGKHVQGDTRTSGFPRCRPDGRDLLEPPGPSIRRYAGNPMLVPSLEPSARGRTPCVVSAPWSRHSLVAGVRRRRSSCG
jgi:hypothetical protein